MTTDTAALEQGSPAWHAARLGKITASRFADVMTQPRSKKAREAGEFSGSACTYMLDLAAEILTGQSQEHRTTAAEQWGLDHEPAARTLYERLMGCEVQRVGFIEHPLDAMIGGSPDGLVGDNGGVEIKCPFNPAIHLAYVLAGRLPKDHVAQVQGHMWITGRTWWDFVSYCPNFNGPGSLKLALWRLRVYRDLEFIGRLDEAVFAFRDRLLETLAKLVNRRNET